MDSCISIRKISLIEISSLKMFYCLRKESSRFVILAVVRLLIPMAKIPPILSRGTIALLNSCSAWPSIPQPSIFGLQGASWPNCIYLRQSSKAKPKEISSLPSFGYWDRWALKKPNSTNREYHSIRFYSTPLALLNEPIWNKCLRWSQKRMIS